MKIKRDFVTNSSTTAYIIIIRSELTREGIRRLMGVSKQSPLCVVADVLFDRLMNRARPIKQELVEYYESNRDPVDFLREDFAEEVAERVKVAFERGEDVRMGKFNSDEEEVESFLCCDSFQIENDEYYLNALRCVW